MYTDARATRNATQYSNIKSLSLSLARLACGILEAVKDTTKWRDETKSKNERSKPGTHTALLFD